MPLADLPLAHRISRRYPARWLARWLRNYTFWKILTDPVYRGSFQCLGASDLPLLDIGCGAGQHAFYLRERGYRGTILGVDVDADKVTKGAGVAARHYPDVELRVGDGASVQAFSGNVTILDVLHYFPAGQRAALLAQCAAQVAPGGWCLIRTTLRDGSVRHGLTVLEERIARAVGWMNVDAHHFPTPGEITAAFDPAHFEHVHSPLWGRTPFNSHLHADRRRT